MCPVSPGAVCAEPAGLHTGLAQENFGLSPAWFLNGGETLSMSHFISLGLSSVECQMGKEK